jgi:hypothetical protein
MQDAALTQGILSKLSGGQSGLLQNFWASSLQVKRKYRTHSAKGKTYLDTSRSIELSILSIL